MTAASTGVAAPIEDSAGAGDATASTASPAAAAPKRLTTVPLGTVVTHPGNPRHDLGDLTELEGSIREVGILHTPVALPAARVAAAWPEHAGTLADADWVVLIGARRRTAYGNVMGNDPDALIELVIREDAIADDKLAQLDVMTAENTARKALTPVEEARAFKIQEDAGRKQRQIADRAGCSQPHVSKRLQLLQLPASMLGDLETGQNPDDDEDQPGTRKPPLQIKDALAYVKATGDGDQFVMLAAHKLAQLRPSWTPKQLVDEVRREQARRVQHEALTRKAADEGVPVVADPEQRFGGYLGAREHRLEAKTAIAAARKAGTLAAAVTSGGLVYYDTASKPPKKADNRSEAEQQRITDERERRTAMTARAAAAAVMAAWPPKLPEAAVDIVDAWLWAPGNDVAQLAQKWLIAAGAGPDPELPGHTWWQQIRAADWPTRVHAAHALALARHEVHTRTTYRTWNETDAAWLGRLTDKTGYTPTTWEQARLDAIGRQAAAPAPPRRVSLMYDHDDNQCWVLHYDLEVDEPAAWAEDLEDPDTLDEARTWAEQLLHDEHDIDVTGWTAGQLLPGYPADIAVFAGAEAAGAEPVDGPAAAPAGPGEYRLLYSAIDDVWMVLRDDEHLADHDGLDPEDLDGACTWASQTVADDCGHQVEGWQSRAGAGAGGLEHVAELVPGRPAAAATAEPAVESAAEPTQPRLVWHDGDGWALYTTGPDPLATTGPDIQAGDPVTAQTWAAEQLAVDDVEVLRWTDHPDGQPGYAAMVATTS